ncbi:GumC family protein [Brevundimonas sp.]|uniref:GumC family protein n=1 Tax=Brevundimonas sp. TaxID=1871086 RepID=UPI002FCB993C
MFGDGNNPGPYPRKDGVYAAPGFRAEDGRTALQDRAPQIVAPGIDVSEYWHLAVKHRLLIAGLLVAATIVGVIITLLMTPIYTASTTIQIDREAARIFNEGDVAPSELAAGEEFFQTQYGLLKSRSLAQRVAEDLGLASSDAFLESMNVEPPAQSGDAAGRSAARTSAVVSALQSNLSVGPVRGSRLVTVSFDSPDPQLAARVANAFATNFIQANLDRKFESSAYARRFLEERIAQTKVNLENAERQLVAYAENQQIINVREPATASGESQSLASINLFTLNGALAEATAARVAAEEKWRQARSAPARTQTEVLQNPAISALIQQRATLQTDYEQKLGIYKPDWPEMVQLAAQIREIDQQIARQGADIVASIQNQYQAAANQERSLRAQVEGLKSQVLDLRDRSVQYNILQRELDTSRTLYDGLLQRYKEVGITGGVTSNNVSIVDAARPPGAPSSPRLLINLAIAAVIGLGLAIIAVFIIEALDETLATPEDVENKLQVPVLGAVPLLEKGLTPQAALDDIRSGFSEAYYSLRTALQFSTPNGAPRSILVTSSRPAEGKSTTAFALAQNLARIGKRVLLVDGDLRNPSMHRLMGVDNDMGMSNLLSGSADLAKVAHATKTPNLWFIPCGPIPPNPAELWGSDRLARFLEAGNAEYDHIVIDGPPILGFADAPILAASVEGTLFALQSRSTRRGQARGALKRLNIGPIKLLGVVLTKFNPSTRSFDGYDYGYDYQYGGQQSKGR